MMDWNRRTTRTANMQMKNVQVWGSNFPQNQHQNNGQSLNSQPVFQNTPVFVTDSRMPQQLVDRGAVSSMPLSNVTVSSMPLSNMSVQMQEGIVQNPWPNSNIQIFNSAPGPGSTVNSMQNAPQTLYMTPVVYGNRLQNNSNSVGTSTYPHASKSRSFSKQLKQRPSYRLNGPSTSQTSVPLNPTSRHLHSLQNFTSYVIPSGQNNQNQINGLSSSAVAMQLQQYSSGHVISAPVAVSTHSYNDASTVIPPVPNINPPPYRAHVQTNYGNLAQPVPNASNANVKNPMNQNHLDQNPAQQNMQCYQKPQLEQSASEISEVGSTACLNEYRSADQLSNESVKTVIPVNENICKNMQIATPQTIKTLVQEKNLPNNLENLSSTTKACLVMDFQSLPDCERVLHQFKDLNIKHQLYITLSKNSKTSDLSANNKNPDVSLPCTTQNQTPMLPHDAKQVFKLPSQDPAPNQSASQGSSQINNVPVSTAKEHLYPILRDMLKGTGDEDMLKVYSTTVEKHQHVNAAVRVNESSSTAFVPGGNKCENDVKGNGEVLRTFSRENQKVSPTVLTGEPLTGTQTSVGLEQQSRSAVNKSANTLSVPTGYWLRYFKQNKEILARLSSSIQNPSSSDGSSPSTKTVLKECSEKFQSLATKCPEFPQQSKHNYLQTSEKNVTSKSSDLTDSSSLATLVEAAVIPPEADLVQKPLVTGNSDNLEGTCSWEELKAGLTLWLKNLPLPINDITESTESLSSKSSGQTLENLPNTLTQNDQTAVETNSVVSSLENQLDSVSSSLLKGSEPQVAIVAPLMQSKESIQIVVQKKNLSALFEMDPIIKEGSDRSVKELSSAEQDTNRERSSIDMDIAAESFMHQNRDESAVKNGMVKAEANFSNSCSFLELKKVKSEVCSEDEMKGLQPDSQNNVTSHESDPNLLKPGDTPAFESDDTMFQISSVCTLVQGDAFYNSQIANIFNTSPVKCTVKNEDASGEHRSCSQQNEQPYTVLSGETETKVTASEEDALLPLQDSLSKAVTEEPSKDLPCLEMIKKDEINAKKNEEKSNDLHEDTTIPEKETEEKFSYDEPFNIDLTSGDQALSEIPDLFSTAVEDTECIVQKENIQEHGLMEENNAQCSISSESPLAVLADQLTELLKEFPNGINDLEVRHSAIKLVEKENKEGTQTCGQNLVPSDPIDQIKISILSSPERKEYFPEFPQSSNKLENSENIIDSEDKDTVSNDTINHIETPQLKHAAKTNVLTTESETYCCLQGFMASRYALKPCSCKLTEGLLQSKNMLEDKPKDSDSYKTNSSSNKPLQTYLFQPMESGSLSKKFLKNTKTILEVKESTQSKGSPEFTVSSSSEKLEPHKPKRTNEEERKELLFSAGCQALKEETTEIKINDQKYLREDQQALSKNKSSHNERRDGMVPISKTDHGRHCDMKKRRREYEKYKIKHDTSETHMIKGPNRLSKSLKRQMATEREHKELKNQHSDVMNSTNLGKADSNGYSNLWHNSSLRSEDYPTKLKGEKSNSDMEKTKETKRLEPNESGNSEHSQPNNETLKRMNLDKFAYSTEKEKAWKYKRFLLNNRRTPKLRKQRVHSNVYKTNSFSKEAVPGSHNRDDWSSRSLSEKTAFHKKITKLTLQREPKKTYLNRVSFTETAQESICLKKLEMSPSKSVWRMKSNGISGNMEASKTSSSSSQQPRKEKPQMLEFKMCPEILLITSEEQSADTKKLPEKDKTPITAVKSKREDWLASPTKRRKTVEGETQVDDHVPLATALKLLDETHSLSVKSSKTTFQTYRKMHLEKRSRSLDSSSVT